MEADLRSRLASVGLATAAFDWVLKACHPAGPGTSPGLPDMSTASVFRPEFKDTCVIAWTGAAGANWDCIAWRPPGDNVCLRWATGPAGYDFTSAAAPTQVGACLMQPTDWTLSSLDEILTPPVRTGAANQIMTSRPLAWRHQFASITSYLTASALNDQGTLYVSTFDRPFIATTLQPWPFPYVPLAFAPYYQQRITSFPTDENRMMLTDPRTYMAPARDGAYVPLRLCGPVQPFVPSYRVGDALLYQFVASEVAYTGFGMTSADGMQALPSLPSFPMVASDTSTAGVVSVPACFSAGAVIPGGNFWAADSGYDNLAHAVFLYRGLSSSATITFKSIAGLEVIPRIDSPILQFVNKPVRYSAGALSFYQAVAEEMRAVYPGSFNSLGTILQAVGQAASAIWPTVRGIGASLLPHVDKALGYTPGAPTPMSTSQVVRLATPARAMGQSSLQKALRSSIKNKPRGGKMRARGKRSASVSTRRSGGSRRR